MALCHQHMALMLLGVQAIVLGMTVFVDLIAAVGVGVSLMSLLYVRDTAEV